MADIKRFYTVGADSKEYEENYNKIKWNDDMEIKEFVKPLECSEFEKWWCKYWEQEEYNIDDNCTKHQRAIWDYQQKRIDKLESKIDSFCSTCEYNSSCGDCFICDNPKCVLYKEQG